MVLRRATAAYGACVADDVLTIKHLPIPSAVEEVIKSCPMSVDTFLTQWRNCERPYLISRGESMSYALANDLAIRISGYLEQEGIVGQNVALLMGNSVAYVLAYFANRLTKSTNIPIDPKLTKHEVMAELDYCDCMWIVTGRQHRKRSMELAGQSGVGVVELQEDCSPVTIKKPTRRAFRENSADIVVMLHTSGTTGNPKKVMLTETNLHANTQSHITSLGLARNDVVLIALPMFFGYCHTSQLLAHTRLGGKIVLYDEPLFTAKRLCELVQTHRVTCFTAVPTMLIMLDRYPYIDSYDLSSLRYICFGGASTPSELLTSLMRKIPSAGFVNTYGQTECSPRVTALLPADALRKIGSIGKAIPGVIAEVVDDNGLPVEVGAIGEIRVAGENITPGYYRKPLETDAIRRNGYLYTGDLARVDDEGYLYLAGRRKTMIISGGINIYPEEIEQAITALPFVDDALALGEEDRNLGEIVVARVVPREGEVVTVERIREALSSRLAQYKLPRKIYITRVLAKTPTGKKRRV